MKQREVGERRSDEARMADGREGSKFVNRKKRYIRGEREMQIEREADTAMGGE